MLYNQFKTKNLFISMAFTLFALTGKPKAKTAEIYWVLEESDHSYESLKVKYFNENDEIIFEETITGLDKGFIDEETISRLNQTKKQLRVQ